MKIRTSMAILIWGLIATAPLGAVTTDEPQRWFAMPMAELEDVVTDWLDLNGYQIYRASSTFQKIELIGEKSGVQLAITLTPQSPLATRIDITTEPVAKGEALRQYLLGYVGMPGADSAPLNAPVPDAVSNQSGNVVCIYANHRNEDVQLTGFIIDPDGWVVCTAHDLIPEQTVAVLLTSGREIRGQVVKLDAEKDLALIRTRTPLPDSVSLRNGRYLLRNGDELYAVTCPNSGTNGIYRGSLDGPPRRVSGQPLWQARIHIDPGSSGSPVFDGHGRLTAIVKGRYRGTDSVGFLIPFETLLHFLEKY